MATITFKAKITTVEYPDGTLAGRRIQCPILKRSHCDMAAFRRHPKYGGYANSDLFAGMLNSIRTGLFGESGVVKLESLPNNVTVSETGFLACVTITV